MECRSGFDPDHDIPPLTGKVIIVTGGCAGLGLETVRQFARYDASRIYIAARSKQKVDAAIREIHATPGAVAPLEFLELDLSSFSSIKRAVGVFRTKETRLDILVNNAGIMMTPEGLTKDGYEVQFGTNHLGHALLTQLLLPLLQETTKINCDVRVVSVSSASERMAPVNCLYPFSELKTTMGDRSTQARYCISKIANVHYSRALARRINNIKFIAVHPGSARTTLDRQLEGWLFWAFVQIWGLVVATSAAKGALNQLWASVSAEAKSGGYYGPVGREGAGSAASQSQELSNQLYKWTQQELQPFL